LANTGRLTHTYSIAVNVKLWPGSKIGRWPSYRLRLYISKEFAHTVKRWPTVTGDRYRRVAAIRDITAYSDVSGKPTFSAG